MDSGPKCNFKNLAALATTTVKTGPGILRSIVINTKGASANVITVYDNTTNSGTTIATIDSTVTTGAFVYNVAFATGLTFVLGTGTAANITVCYE